MEHQLDPYQDYEHHDTLDQYDLEETYERGDTSYASLAYKHYAWYASTYVPDVHVSHIRMCQYAYRHTDAMICGIPCASSITYYSMGWHAKSIDLVTLWELAQGDLTFWDFMLGELLQDITIFILWQGEWRRLIKERPYSYFPLLLFLL